MSNLLEATENRLFNRIMQNAAKGFIKGAAIGVALGAAVGGVIFGLGVIPAAFVPEALLGMAGGSIPMAGAMIGASICLLPAGRIGQIAGVQSTRDARRYLLAHEAARKDTHMPPEADPLREVAETVAEKIHARPRQVSYRSRISAETAGPSSPSPG